MINETINNPTNSESVSDSPESIITESSSSDLEVNQNNVKKKIQDGVYKIILKRGRKNSKVWDIFGNIQTESEQLLPHLVACKMCLNVYKFNKKSTSNLVKHKCYIIDQSTSTSQKQDVDAETKKHALFLFVDWSIKNCRPFLIVEDGGLQNLLQFFVTLGAKFGANVDVKKLVPHPTTLSRNINKVYHIYVNKVKEELSTVKNIGLALTSDLWTDNYLKLTYICVTVHYIKDGKLINRVLAVDSMDHENCTSLNINKKVCEILNVFDIEYNENIIVVTDRGRNMVAAFRTQRINCLNHLLNNLVEKACSNVPEALELIKECTKLVKYFKKASLNHMLETTLKSYVPTRWNTIFYLLESIAKNWIAINDILIKKGQLSRVSAINLNNLTDVKDFLKHFEEMSKKVEGTTYVTLHTAYAYSHFLKKQCEIIETDIEILKKLKLQYSHHIDEIIFDNLSKYHRIALYLFPPFNNMLQFTDTEREEVKSECKNLLRNYLVETSETNESSNLPTLSSNTLSIYGDFIRNQTIPLSSSEERIEREINIYDNSCVYLHDDFNVIQWWELHKVQLPLLYKASKKVLAIPASSADSERAFSHARNLITEKRSSLNPTLVNQIMFLHNNIEPEKKIQDFLTID